MKCENSKHELVTLVSLWLLIRHPTHEFHRMKAHEVETMTNSNQQNHKITTKLILCCNQFASSMEPFKVNCWLKHSNLLENCVLPEKFLEHPLNHKHQTSSRRGKREGRGKAKDYLIVRITKWENRAQIKAQTDRLLTAEYLWSKFRDAKRCTQNKDECCSLLLFAVKSSLSRFFFRFLWFCPSKRESEIGRRKSLFCEWTIVAWLKKLRKRFGTLSKLTAVTNAVIMKTNEPWKCSPDCLNGADAKLWAEL